MKILLAIAFLSTGLQAAETPAGPTYKLSPERTVAGETSLLRIKPAEGATLPAELKATAGEATIGFFECPDEPSERCGFVPVSVEAKDAALDIVIADTPPATVTLKTKEGKFRNNILKVDPDLVHPNEADQKRIDQDKADIAAAYTTGSAAPIWDGKFVLPVKSDVTSKFGNRRSFNGELKSVHFGVDLRAGLKTPIRAANAGKVIFAKETLMAGNLTIVDHGAGVFTGYAHMSKIGVTVGQTVKKNEKLGMAGATGRVTGPHLHWTMRASGLAVDPHQFLTVFNRMYGKKTSKSLSRK